MNHQLEQVIDIFQENCSRNNITAYDIFKGIKLLFVSLESENFSFQHPAFDHILEINYCKSGRIGWQNGKWQQHLSWTE